MKKQPTVEGHGEVGAGAAWVERDYQPVAYANLIRLKRSALDLFNRLKRP